MIHYSAASLYRHLNYWVVQEKCNKITILALIDRSQYSLSYEAKYKSKFNMVVLE